MNKVGKKPMRHLFRHKMRTVAEVAAILGMTTSPLYRRLRVGRPLDFKSKSGRKSKLVAFKGEHLTRMQIQDKTGFSYWQVRQHVSGGMYMLGGAA